LEIEPLKLTLNLLEGVMRRNFRKMPMRFGRSTWKPEQEDPKLGV
jgi:hypothetical protein